VNKKSVCIKVGQSTPLGSDAELWIYLYHLNDSLMRCYDLRVWFDERVNE